MKNKIKKLWWGLEGTKKNERKKTKRRKMKRKIRLKKIEFSH